MTTAPIAGKWQLISSSITMPFNMSTLRHKKENRGETNLARKINGTQYPWSLLMTSLLEDVMISSLSLRKDKLSFE